MWYLKRVLMVGSIIAGIIVFRVLVLELFQVAQYSMEETYNDGSVVLVNKLAYGARLPMHLRDIPFAEAVAFMVGKVDDFQGLLWSYRRMPGYTWIKLDDVVVFEHPSLWSREKLIKRCLALPGDSVVIVDNRRFINGKEILEPASVKYSYSLYAQQNGLIEDSLNEYGVLARDFLWQSDVAFHYAMTNEKAAALDNCSLTDSVVLDNYPIGAPGPQLFPYNRQFTRENYGPIVVPAKGMNVLLDSINIPIFHDAIVLHENNTLEVINEEILINGEPETSYTFKYDYYFLVGDNRYHSSDSRYFGFVPEFLILGKVGPVLISGHK